jgi:signal transduction histidine kinase
MAFISSNLGALKEGVSDLLAVIAAYRNAASLIAASPAVEARIRETEERADLEFLRTDLGALIVESLEGAGRVKRIVQDLKDFSRADSGEWAMARLESGIDSTINIVWNEIKYKAELVKEYAGLPEVECIAGQLNQVFMNLLINAAHAIEEQGQITMRTGHDGEHVWVEVEDTGKGIEPEHLGRIFEPFFTTKPVGKGTGLGLSLSYGIVSKHGGRIEVKSEVGKGSIFRVVLPRNAGADNNAPA